MIHRYFQSVLMALLFSVSLGGCGALGAFDRIQSPEGYTTVRFSSGNKLSASENLQDTLFATTTTAIFSGGIIIYATPAPNMAGSPMAINLYDEYDTKTATLVNGTYQFYALGYTQPNLGGMLYCGQVGSNEYVTLSGTTMTINFSMSTSNCYNGAYFQSPAYPLSQFSVKSCNTVQFTSPPFCTVTGDFAYYKVSIAPFRFQMAQLPPPFPMVESPCLQENTGTFNNIPTGFYSPPSQSYPEKRIPIPIRITAYSDPACTAAFRTIDLPMGLIAYQNSISYEPIYNPNSLTQLSSAVQVITNITSTITLYLSNPITALR